MKDAQESNLGKGRLESFSDGVLAIAVTLLILEVHVPTPHGIVTAADQLHNLLAIWPQYLVYFVSFATIGIMWLNHHALFRNVRTVSHGMIVANLLLLALISFLPFPTEVLAQYGLTGVAVAYYGVVMTTISVAYTLVFLQVLAAHNVAARLKPWSIVGLSTYPIASIIGYFFPLAGIICMALLAAFYLQPRNVQSILSAVS